MENLLRKLFNPRSWRCWHHGDWKPIGFSYVECGKCGVRLSNPSKCSELNSEFISILEKLVRSTRKMDEQG